MVLNFAGCAVTGRVVCYDAAHSSTMELPIFNDNLKSSASWNQQLAQAQAQCQPSPTTVREAQVAQLARHAAFQDAQRLRDAAELVSSWAVTADARFDQTRLLALQTALLGSAAALRKTEPLPLHALHDPAPAVLLPRLLDNAFDWFATAGFDEMHPVEQAAVVFLRLLDLHPFAQHAELTALLAASFYTERAGLPPLFIFTDDVTRRRFTAVIESALRMLTQPLVEFFAEQLTRALQLGERG